MLNNHNYNPYLADQSVGLSRLIGNRRLWKQIRQVVVFVLFCVYERMTVKSRSKSKACHEARRLRETLVSLGETFIKLGQFLSVRRDALPVEFLDELSLLVDNVPPFSLELVRKTVKADLGQDPEGVFDGFESTPFASASIGQVHRAYLKSGQPVVVKVQRPDLSERFYQDLGLMRLLISIGRGLDRGKTRDRSTDNSTDNSTDKKWDNWLALSNEFGRTLFLETDYIQEGRNTDRIRRLMRSHVQIRIPRVYWKYTGRRVLMLEYLPGIKINNMEALVANNINIDKVTSELVDSYLDQILCYGFFHADPHAGNLSIDKRGNIIMYDFGMMGEITKHERSALLGCISAFTKGAVHELIDYLQSLTIISQDTNSAPVVQVLETVVDSLSRGKDADLNLMERNMGAINEVFSLPPTLAYLLKTSISLESIARTLKPDFDFAKAIKPRLKKAYNDLQSFPGVQSI